MEPDDREERRRDSPQRPERPGRSRLRSARGPAQRPRRPRKCPECGAEAPRGKRECEECGASLRWARPEKGGLPKKLLIPLIVAIVIGVGLAAVVFLAPESLRETLKSWGVPMKTAEKKKMEKPTEPEGASGAAPAEKTGEPMSGVTSRPAKAAASTLVDESKGPSAREPIPGVEGFGVETRPDLSGGGPAAPTITTGDEIK